MTEKIKLKKYLHIDEEALLGNEKHISIKKAIEEVVRFTVARNIRKRI